MKTSEEKLNEALREALKRKFDDLESLPNPSAYSAIRAQLHEPRRYKYLFLTILLTGLFIAGIVMDKRWSPENEGRKVSGNVDVTKPAIAHLKKNKVNLDVEKQRVTFSKIPKTVLGVTQKKLSIVTKPSIVSADKVLTKLSSQAKGNGISDQNINNSDIINSQLIEISDQEEADQEDADQKDVAEIKLPAIESLEPEDVRFQKMNMPGIAVSVDAKIQNANHTNSKKLAWILNVASLKTYQIITVPKTAGKDFQNFKFPSVFSLESLGYKISAGFEKNGFQVLGHYSAFRQSYSYEIAGSKYIVKNLDKNDIKVERQGTVVHENRNMEMLGLGINKQFEWGRSPFRKYYAAAGLEYSHTLKGSQNIGWINAGFGRQFSVNRQVLFKIGPYAEFSPVRVSGDGGPFYYQPYRVGISLGMKLIKP